VVDGSNLATEGRNLPSLAQLDEAVQSFHAERPGDEIIVVVDASFGYRIDESERKIFEEAEEAGEIVSPPAGAIGRGDGFLLRIADRIDAVVLSNDSFQEFHGEYLWLFDEGRLIGGKPVPSVGWIFTPRSPVRGPKSRVATRDADRARRRVAAPVAPEPVAEAIAEATAEAIDPEAPTSAGRGGRRRSRGGASTVAAETGPPEAINEPLPFITFIADHPLGTEVEGTVDSFTSHGAFVIAAGARCYAPVSGLGDPPPRSAKEVLKRGDVHTFVIQALDPPRRGIELALPGLAKVAGSPTDETVEAEIDAGSHALSVAEFDSDAGSDTQADSDTRVVALPTKPRRSGRTSSRAAVVMAESAASNTESETPPAPAKPRRSRKAAAPRVEVAAEIEPAPTEPAPTEPAPAKRAPRSRKKGPVPVGSESPDARVADSREDLAPAVSALVKKAATRRTTAKKSAAMVGAPADGSEPVPPVVTSLDETPAGAVPVKKAATGKSAPARRSAKKAGVVDSG